MFKKLRLRLAKLLLPKEYEIDPKLNLTHDYYMLQYAGSLKALKDMKYTMDVHFGEDWRDALYMFVKNAIEEIEDKKRELQEKYQRQNKK